MPAEKGRALETLRSYLVDNLGLSPDAAISSQDELGLDSLDIVELVMELEEEFEVPIPDYVAVKINTIGDAINYIERMRRG